VGAGPPPLTVHPERLPPVVRFDAAAADAAVRWRLSNAGGPGDAHASTLTPDRLAELAGWIAGCTGSVPPPAREHVVAPGGAGRALATVGHVARAVDAGREHAAAAAAAGATVVVAAGAGEPAILARVEAWLTGEAVDSAIRGPLGALWRLGDEQLAVLCGVALGAGEHGLAVLYAGSAGTAAAGLAVAVQPALRDRVRLASGSAWSLPAVVRHGEGEGAEAAIAVLRRACP
jgi:hypothetical protein